MKHLGDITKISGYTAPIVDCIVGGSPCQDLSVAGKRAGLDGERSGLFMEQVRIVKEMRNRERLNGKSGVDIRPRYMVWENVPGALSSGKPKGEDFRIVLEEIAKVADKDAVIPGPPKGKWQNSGCILGDGWSIAWRILDAQFWGTPSKPLPQRRRRIALVADFGGSSASEILFVRKSVSGDIEPGEPKGKEASSDASGGIGADDNVFCFEPGAAKRLGGYVWEGLAPTLRTEVGDNRPSVAYTLKIRSGCEGGGKGALVQEDKSATLATNNDQYLFQPMVMQCYSVDQGGGKSACNVTEGQAPTLTCTHGGEPAVCYSLQGGGATSQNSQGIGYSKDISYTINTVDRHAVCYPQQAYDKYIEDDIGTTLKATGGSYGGGSENLVLAVDTSHADDVVRLDNIVAPLQARDFKGGKLVATRYIVRRLTPLECERLQGYPDGWTDIGEWTDTNGKKRQTSDAARYKALGNSIALPPWKWVLKRLCACYERDATMASLFDGIGGFPYLWEQINGKGSCLWASEIEEFPIAVTKVRIGE